MKLLKSIFFKKFRLESEIDITIIQKKILNNSNDHLSSDDTFDRTVFGLDTKTAIRVL